MISTTTEAVSGQSIPAYHVNNLAQDVADAYKAALGGFAGQSPWTAPSEFFVTWDLWHKSSSFTYGVAAVTSNGFFTLPGLRGINYDFVGNPGQVTDFSTGNTSATAGNTQFTNEAFLLPPHGALSVKKYAGVIRMGFTSDGTHLSTLDQVIVKLIKVNAAGTETVLDTQTVGLSATNGATTTVISEAVFSHDFGGSPQAIASGERLGLRVQATGHVATGGTITAGVNWHNVAGLPTNLVRSILALSLA